jgi:hypothetical protein
MHLERCFGLYIRPSVYGQWTLTRFFYFPDSEQRIMLCLTVYQFPESQTAIAPVFAYTQI